MKVDLKIDRRHLLLREITIDPSFQFRHAGNDKGHVKGLVQVLRAVGDLDPVLVWQERGTGGEPTGQLVLLDGGYRLAAYASARGSRGGVPARVLNGDREEAMMAAVQANSRESLSLTQQERMDAAWRLVRLPGRRITVKAIAGVAAVAPRTVDNMRKRWAVMVSSEGEPSGHWWRDRQDDLPVMDDRPEMTDKERRKRIEEVATRLREAFGKLPWQDQDLAAEALLSAVGTPKLRNMTVYALGGDEFRGDESDYFDPDLQPPEAASGGDF